MAKKSALPADDNDPKSFLVKFQKIILDLIGNIPESPETPSENPKERAREIISAACLKAAAVSGSLAIPPGPLGVATILPDLYLIWKIQAKMVADIAATFGKKPALTRETMLYCLFRHAASQIVRDLVARVGERVLIRRASLRVFQGMLERIGIKITQRVAGEFISRWIPIIGAIGVGAYAYYDTGQVGKTSADLFSKNIELLPWSVSAREK
jgi:hypothetical protein